MSVCATMRHGNYWQGSVTSAMPNLDDLNREQLLVNEYTFAPEVGLEAYWRSWLTNSRRMETTPWWSSGESVWTEDAVVG